MIMSVTLVFAGSESEEDVPVIIGYKDKPGKPDKDMVRDHGGKIKYSYNTIDAIAAKLPSRAIDALRKNPNINYIEKDFKVSIVAETLPYGVDRINAELVHPFNKGTGIKVAVIDTGIDYTHPDIDGNYIGGIDLVNGDAYPLDDNGHGTHVAGIIAAEDNDFGVIGVAPEAHLLGVKVLDKSGSGYVSDVIAGIDWSVAQGVRIISMSLGSDGGSISLERACNNAYNAGILVIAAAGNDGSLSGNDDSTDYPARYGSVIAVSATDSSDNRASWSSTGPDVEIAAPGVSIYSTYPGGYRYMSGTSMAAPHVSGTAALVMASNTDLTNVEVRQRLQDTAYDLGTAGKDNLYGYGLVDAYGAAPIPDNTAPAQVTGVTITEISSSVLGVSWVPNTEPDLNDYMIYRSTIPGFSPGLNYLIATSTTNSYSDSGLTPGTNYFYRISAKDTSGNEGLSSNEISGTTPDAPLNTVHIASIDMSKTTYKYRGWRTMGVATVTIVDAYGYPVSGVSVSGRWSGLTSDSDSGSTNVDGRVSLSSNTLKNPSGTYIFTVDTVSKTGWNYDPGSNVETQDSITV